MKKYILIILSLLILFFELSCNSPTAPKENDSTDTTSNNFTWQKFTFGGNAGSSSFYDVTIIDENNIWAVGEVYLDSVDGNPDPFPYNAAHWDGSKWDLQKVPYYYQGLELYSPIYSILAFNTNDIWFGIGNLIHWDGIQYKPIEVGNSFGGLVRKMWGISDNNFYIVGDGGSIALHTANGWQKVQTGTTLQFTDIYGAISVLGLYQILAVCTQNYPPSKGIFSIQGNAVTEISSDFDFPGYTVPPELYGVWFVPNKHYYIVGDGIYEKNSLSESIWKNGPLDITHYAVTEIRGNDLNDVFAVGSFGEVLHYNGKRWTSYINETGLDNGSYSGLAVKRNLVVATGANNQQAVIIIGRSNNLNK